ncbi:MAG TPA: Urease accessory protein [Nitrososphaera sp.]|nr:Urease accessory protein [Nitrososphaera sp.]
MLAVTSVDGNIFSDRRLAEKYRRAKTTGKCERLTISRVEMERLRLRRRTDRGTDIGLVLELGVRLRHGDVLAAKEKFIVAEQLPEMVLSVRMKKSDVEKMVGLAALIGHTIGNRHRPIAVDHGTISFPIQAESEVDTFRKLLPAGSKLKVTEQVFLPAGEVHSHE